MEIERAKAAMENAETWLGSANSNYRDNHYSTALYSLEMSAEIALKAVLLSIKVNPPKVHDISLLVLKYAEENGKLEKIKENEKFIKETFMDLLLYRNSAGYMFEYLKSEKEFKEMVENYLPKVEKILIICKSVISKSKVKTEDGNKKY